MMNQRIIFSDREKKIFRQLVCEYIDIIELKRNDVESIRRKMESWNEITERFNSHQNVTKRRPHQLKKLWHNMKVRGQVGFITVDDRSQEIQATSDVNSSPADNALSCVSVSLNNHHNFISDGSLCVNSDPTSFLSITVHDGDNAASAPAIGNEVEGAPLAVSGGSQFLNGDAQVETLIPERSASQDGQCFADAPPNYAAARSQNVPSRFPVFSHPTRARTMRSVATKNSAASSSTCVLKRKMAELCNAEHRAKMDVYRIQKETEEIKKQAAAAKLQLLKEQREYVALKRRLLESSKEEVRCLSPL